MTLKIESEKIIQPTSAVLLYAFRPEHNVDLLAFKSGFDKECRYNKLLIYRSSDLVEDHNINGFKTPMKYYYFVFSFPSRQKYVIDFSTRALLSPIYYRYEIGNVSIQPMLVDHINWKKNEDCKLNETLSNSYKWGSIELLEVFHPLGTQSYSLKDHFNVIFKLETVESFYDYIIINNLFFHVDEFLSKIEALTTTNKALEEQNIDKSFVLPPFYSSISKYRLSPETIKSIPEPINNSISTQESLDPSIKDALLNDSYKDVGSILFTEKMLNGNMDLFKEFIEPYKTGKIKNKTNGISFLLNYYYKRAYRYREGRANKTLSFVYEYLSPNLKESYKKFKS